MPYSLDKKDIQNFARLHDTVLKMFNDIAERYEDISELLGLGSWTYKNFDKSLKQLNRRKERRILYSELIRCNHSALILPYNPFGDVINSVTESKYSSDNLYIGKEKLLEKYTVSYIGTY